MGDEEEQSLVPTDLGGDRAVALGRAGLAAQRIDARGDRRQHVLDARQVLLRAAQAQLGLVPAGMQAADAGGILQDAAPRLGLGRDQLRHLALAHHGGGARPVAASANISCTSRARTSRPLTR